MVGFDQNSLRLLSSVLGYKPLGEGGSFVSLFEEREDSGLTAFRFQLAGLSSPIREALVLCERDPGSAEVAELLRRLRTPKSRQVVVVPDEFLAYSASGKRSQEPISLNELFSRLANVPKRLPELIRQKGRRDFNHSHYDKRYQERQVEVLHSPTPRWKPHGWRPATEYLTDWAKASTVRHPIILLGERGSGKTWQLFRFCQTVFSLHRSNPWSFGPAFYLELRDESLYSNPFGLSAGLFSDAVLRNYSEARYALDARLLEAFVAAGHTTLCLDGFEEIPQVTQGDETVALGALRRICAGLPLGSRFVIACRAAQFGALDRMLNLEVWPHTRLGEAFEVVQLKPFSEENVRKYIAAAGQGDTAGILLRIVIRNEKKSQKLGWSSEESVKDAVRICCAYPALLAAMVERKSTGRDVPLSGVDFLQAALVDGVITHNIDMGKTVERYAHPRKGVLRLDTPARLEILGELTWHLAARGQEVVDMRAIPPRIKLLYGLDLEAVQKDLRTHTLLEIFPPEMISGDGAVPTPVLHSGDRLRLSIRPITTEGSAYFPQINTADKFPTVTGADLRSDGNRGKQLTTTALRSAPIGVTSVSGAFLLARHISRRLRLLSFLPSASTPDGSIEALDRWRPLGGVPLAPPSAALLREMLNRSKASRRLWGGVDSGGLVRAAISDIARAAGNANLSVFSPCLRYLGHNLEAMGLISTDQRADLDPWVSEDVASIVRPPTGLPEYRLVLVPPAPPQAVPEELRKKGLGDTPPGAGSPLLMGVREITNEDFRRFLETKEGAEWKVDRMTLAGSFRQGGQSRFAKFANEYYLYFWQHSAASGQHEPEEDALNHPVVYASWHSCAAFCNWLTAAESRAEVYGHLRLSEEAAGWRVNEQLEKRAFPGYRLPTAAEWSWGARGYRLDVEYPWELYPLVLPEREAPRWLTVKSEVSSDSDEEEARDWLRNGRAAYREVLTTSTKEHVPVLSDPLGAMGISGMMGNVKEWCHDTVGNGLEERAILGATSLLGTESYHYSYGTSLFPQNTNPDVGFRVCRPLSEEETQLLQHHEIRISRCVAATVSPI